MQFPLSQPTCTTWKKIQKYLQIQETVRIELIATAIGLVYFISEKMANVEKTTVSGTPRSEVIKEVLAWEPDMGPAL